MDCFLFFFFFFLLKNCEKRLHHSRERRGGRVVRWSWVNFLPVPGRPTILTIVGPGPIALAVGAGGGLFGPISI